jgi:hypothetical protein
LICGQSNFDGEVVKHHQNLEHDAIKDFLVFFQVKLGYTFFGLFLYETFFWSSFSNEFNVPWPQQSFHQISSIKPCSVPGFLHCLKNLLLMDHLYLKL